MKTLTSIMAALVMGTSFSFAASEAGRDAMSNIVNYGSPFIFVEGGVTFSVYPDGELDFYINNRVNVGASVNFGNANITFNSGYDYNPYVQYDDYGAVIQVENVPVYYDYYGRVNQIGNINIWYGNGRVNRIGGLYVHYNNRGIYSHYTGYINVYNRYYVYRPFHRYFIRPAVGFCLVYNRPYRRYYSPVRYTYYRPYAHNYRKPYARVGHAYKYHKEPRRGSIYRNDRRVAVRDNAGRRSDSYRSDKGTHARREAVTSNRRSVQGKDLAYSGREASGNYTRKAVGNNQDIRQRGNSGNLKNGKRNYAPETRRSVSPNRERTVTQRTVTRSSGNKSVSRSATTVKRQHVAPKAVRTETRSTRTVTSRAAAPTRKSRDYKSGSVNKSLKRSPVKLSRSNQGVRERSKSPRRQ